MLPVSANTPDFPWFFGLFEIVMRYDQANYFWTAAELDYCPFSEALS